MVKKKEITLADLSDPFIYYNGKNYIYCGPFSKTGYILGNNDAKAYSIYSTRFFIPLSLGVIAFFVGMPWYVSLAAFVGMQIIMGVSFRKKLLANLPVIENFEKPDRDESFIDKVAKKYNKVEFLLPLICSILLVFDIPINAKKLGYEGGMLIGNYVVAFLMVLLSIFFFICFLRARKK